MLVVQRANQPTIKYIYLQNGGVMRLRLKSVKKTGFEHFDGSFGTKNSF